MVGSGWSELFFACLDVEKLQVCVHVFLTLLIFAAQALSLLC